VFVTIFSFGGSTELAPHSCAIYVHLGTVQAKLILAEFAQYFEDFTVNVRHNFFTKLLQFVGRAYLNEMAHDSSCVPEFEVDHVTRILLGQR
jgi:hypothetical protein